MTSLALLLFSVSVVLFSSLILIVRSEQKRNKRFALKATRGFLDAQISAAEQTLRELTDHFLKYVVKLHWYYSIHSLLRAILGTLVSFYTFVERHFEKNRRRTKILRKEKAEKSQRTHLDQIAQHKIETALTPAQQKRLRKKKLEEKH